MTLKYIRILLSLVVIAGIISTIPVSIIEAVGEPQYINGKIAYVDTQSGNRGIWMRNGDGSSPIQVHTASGILSSPEFSPNGKKLAFNEGTPAEIYTINVDGTGLINLSNNVSRDEGPAWSPLGDKIAFVSDRGRATAEYRLWIMDADGGNQTEISNPLSQGDRFPSWSPDGTKIYYSSRRAGIEQIWVYDTVAMTDTQFTTFSTTAIAPVVSPDGNKVVFAHAEPTDTRIQLYVQDADGSNFQKLYELCSDGYSQYPRWSPDGRKILFISECGTSPDSKLYMVNSDGSGSAKLISDNPNEDVWTRPGWQRLPVSSTSVDPDSGDTEVEVGIDEDYEDTDYEVEPNFRLIVNGKIGNVIVRGLGFLKGSGTVGNVNIEQSARLAPGTSPGCLNSGDLTLETGSFLDQELGGTTVCSQYDRTTVTGTVTLNNPTLNTILFNGFVPAVSDTFTIIDNDSNDAVVGTFNGLAEGASFTSDGVTYNISYTGGDGNDVVLSVTSVAADAGSESAGADPSTTPGVPNTGVHLDSVKLEFLLLVTLVSASTLVVVRRLDKTR